MPPRHTLRILLTAAIAGTLTVHAQQQSRGPNIGYIYPAGGQIGTTFEITAGGQNLNNVTNALITGPGIQAQVLPYETIVSSKQANDLRERGQELRKKTKTPDVIKELLEIRRKLIAFERRRTAPALAESVPIQITISPNAPPGKRELRLGSLNGLSNPLVFQVGQLPEYTEPELKEHDTFTSLKNINKQQPGPSRAATTNTPPTAITLPATLNGQILPGKVDRYIFHARQDQQLIVDVSARELIPYLADAVPGWFQAKVVLYDAQHKELTYDDHYRFNPDPVLFYTIPKEGDYILEIRDSIYRGREDFVYRVAIGELPFITNLYPLGAQTGTQPTITFRGFNLPITKHNPNLATVEPGLYPIAIPAKPQNSNTMPFMVDTLPELAQAPAATTTNAQYVTLPVIINGRIEKQGDVHSYRFDARAGQQLVAEVIARRLNSPLDSALKLTDATGKQIAFNDDFEDKASGLNTHHADSYLTATLPATGTYYLHLWDTQQKAGPDYAYRLRISPPRPDYTLRVVPSSITIRPYASATLTVFALRRDGLTNAINITLKNPPEGFKLSGTSLVGTQEQAKVTITVSSKTPSNYYNLTLEGHTTLAGHDLIHTAVPADDMMQAFAYRHLVPSQELKAYVPGPYIKPKEKKTTTAPTPAPTALKIPAGGTARTQITIPNNDYTGKLILELDEPPDGITIKNYTATRTGAEIVLQTDPAKIKPGQKGELTVLGYAEKPKSPQQSGKPRTPLGSIPPIRFEIVSP